MPRELLKQAKTIKGQASAAVTYSAELSFVLCYSLAPSTYRESNRSEMNLVVSDLNTSQ